MNKPNNIHPVNTDEQQRNYLERSMTPTTNDLMQKIHIVPNNVTLSPFKRDSIQTIGMHKFNEYRRCLILKMELFSFDYDWNGSINKVLKYPQVIWAIENSLDGVYMQISREMAMFRDYILLYAYLMPKHETFFRLKYT